MTLPYVPGATFEGKVIYVYPYLDRKTREVKVRLEFENPKGLLKPGMFANVDLRSTLARDRTLAPREAIIDTGERKVAFVSLGAGRFEPRRVRVGAETSGGMVEILDGLKPGEMVVTSGQFLIDSEAKIREALAKMIGGASAADQQAVAAVVGVSELRSLPAAIADGIGTMLEAYFEIGDRLAADSIDGVEAAGHSVADSMTAVMAVAIPDDPHFWPRHEEGATVRGRALEIAATVDLEAARVRYGELSVALDKLIRATGVPRSFDRPVQQLRCPMYRTGQGGTIWLQPDEDVRNPYYGSAMLGCFDERVTLPVTGPAGDATGTPGE